MSDSIVGEAISDAEGKEAPQAEANGKAEAPVLSDQKPGWLLSMPKEYQNDEEMLQFGRIGDFLKHHKEIVASQGVVPGSEDGYEFAAEDIPEGMPRNEGFEKHIRGLAAREKLTNEQARAVYREELAYSQRQLQGYNETREQTKTENVTALKTQLGDDGYKQAQGLVKRVFDRYDSSGSVLAKLQQSGAADDAEVFLWLRDLGADMVGDSTPQGGPGVRENSEVDERAARYNPEGTMMKRMRARQSAGRR